MLPSVCPKCAAQRPAGSDACPRCGLLVSRWSGWSAELPEHPVLDALWAKVEAGWEDDTVHARFLDQAAAVGALDLAATRYRTRLRQDNAPRAQAGLDRAVKLALRLQGVQAPDHGLSIATRWVKIAGIAVAIALFAATMWVVLATLSRR